MSGSAFSTTLILPADALEITSGEPVLGGMHAADLAHYHCDWCKSWVFTRPPAEYGIVNVRATMLDDATWFAPFMETCTSEKLPWAQTGAPHGYAQFPDPSEFPKLIQAFAETNA